MDDHESPTLLFCKKPENNSDRKQDEKQLIEVASIPDEAISSLERNVAETSNFSIVYDNESSQHVQYANNGLKDPALIPRVEILEQIVKHFSSSKEEVKIFEQQNASDRISVHSKMLTLRGMGGLGKTTLAAMAVNLIELRSAYDHILWVNLGSNFKVESVRNNLSYDMYLNCLRKLCQQLNIKTDKFDCELFLQPGDTKILISGKVLQAMEQAKMNMAHLVNNLRILIVLDDVWSHEDVDLFNFGEHTSSLCSILITTRTLDLAPFQGSRSIEVNFLNASEARYLFLVQAGLSFTVSEHNLEVIDCIIQKCGHLPLAVRAAGRLAKTSKKIQLKLILEEILGNIGGNVSQGISPIVRILDHSFLFVTNETTAFAVKMLFSAFALLFQTDECLRPWVSRESVKLMWVALRLNEGSEELKLSWRKFNLTKVDQITDLMCEMGLLDRKIVKLENEISDTFFRIHHDLMWDYGKMFATRYDFKRISTMSFTEQSQFNFNLCVYDFSDNFFNQNLQRWAKLLIFFFIKLHQVQRNEYNDYNLNWLPLHLMKAGFLNDASNMLKNENFLTDIFKKFGLEMGMQSIMSFMRTFERLYQTLPVVDTPVYTSPMILVIYSIHDYITKFNSLVQVDCSTRREIGSILIVLGTELHKYSEWTTSLDYYTEALEIFYLLNYDNDHPDVERVVKHMDSCVVQRLMLVSLDSPYRIKLKHNGKNTASKFSLELSSHPGYAIVKTEDKCKTIKYGKMMWSYVYLGIGLQDSALEVNYDGCLTHRDQFICVALGALSEGMPLSLRSKTLFDGINVEEELEPFNDSSLFTIDSDGSVYPTMAPNLCLGFSPYPIMYLVRRNSPNRAVLKYTTNLNAWKEPDCCSSGSDISTRSKKTRNGVILELSSHPGMGIVPFFNEMTCTPKLNNVKVLGLGLGPLELALSAKVNGKNHFVMTQKHKGAALCHICQGDLKVGEEVFLSTPFHKWNYEFVSNDDGTISPAGAPHLVLGFQVPGRSMYLKKR